MAGRPKDHEDGRALLRGMDEIALQGAREMLTLIDRRGFGRGKDLLVELCEIEASASAPEDG